MPSMTLQVGAVSADGRDDGHVWTSSVPGPNHISTAAGNNYVGDQRQSSLLADYHTWIRFHTTTEIPAGATITNAYITLRATNNRAAFPTIHIHAHQTANAGLLSNLSEWNTQVSNKTATFVAWTPTAWVSGTDYQSPDISSVIQALLDNTGAISSGDGLLLFLLDSSSEGWSGTENRIQISTYETSPALAPQLYIEWTEGGTTHSGTASETQSQTATAIATITLAGNATSAQEQSATAAGLLTRIATADAAQGQAADASATLTRQAAADATQGQTASCSASVRRRGAATATQAQAATADATIEGALIVRQGSASAAQGQSGEAFASLRTQAAADAGQGQSATAAGILVKHATAFASQGQDATAAATVDTGAQQGAVVAVQGQVATAAARAIRQGMAIAAQGQTASVTIFTAITVGRMTLTATPLATMTLTDTALATMTLTDTAVAVMELEQA